MCVEPGRNQLTVLLPSRPRVRHAFAHDESSRHVRFGETLHEPPRLLNRNGSIGVSVNQNGGRVVSRDTGTTSPVKVCFGNQAAAVEPFFQYVGPALR